MNRIVLLVMIFSIVAMVPLALPSGQAVESNLVILGHYYYEDTAGYSNVIGEVQNLGTTTTAYIQLNVTFYDTMDNQVATGSSYSIVDILLPGEMSPFEVSSYPVANLSVAYYVVEGTYHDIEEVPYREFAIIGVNDYVLNDWYYISGEVENIGFLNASLVEVVASFYDENDTLIAYDWYIDLNILEPGQRVPFEVRMRIDEIVPASYALMVQCWETREPSMILCIMEPTIQEEELIVEGILVPPLEQVEVILTYIPPNESSFDHYVITESDGSFFDVIEDPVPGNWTVKAWWLGDTTYVGAVSEPAVVTLSTWVTTVTCTTSATNLSVGAPILLEGVLAPDLAAPVSINLEYTMDSLWQPLTTLMTFANGSYSYLWTPTSGGNYSIRARYAGTVKYEASESAVLNLEIAKRSTSLSCSAPTAAVDVGKPFTVSGQLEPALSDVTVTLTYQPPSGAAISRSVTTNADGEYSDSYTPSDSGTWRVTARWDGDNAYNQAASATRTFTVQKSGCLIATATFGSALTPQVQVLRSFRDNRVLTTFAGRQFLNVFNSFYYSFSPQVAETIRITPGLALVMTAVVSPLIGVLQISEQGFALMSESPELAIVLAGGIASMLLAAIYLVPGAWLISRWTHQVPSKRWLMAIGLLWLASLTAIGLAEVAQASWLMGTATSTFVLATIGATLITALRQASHLWHILRQAVTWIR